MSGLFWGMNTVLLHLIQYSQPFSHIIFLCYINSTKYVVNKLIRYRTFSDQLYATIQEIQNHYGTWRFIPITVKMYPWTWPWGSSIQFVIPQHIFQQSILVLFSHMHIRFENSVFPWDFPTQILHVFLVSVLPVKFLLTHSNTTRWTVRWRWRVKINKFFSLCILLYLFFYLFSIQIFFSALCLKILKLI